MPRLTMRINGMVLMVRRSSDRSIDLRFITREIGGHPHGHHHDPPELHQHVPLLMVSTDAWSGVGPGLAGNEPRRAPGRPVYLASYDSVKLTVNDADLAGGVTVSDNGPVTRQPSTDEDWNNFAHLILPVAELFPGASYSEQIAARVAPFARFRLTGGYLGTERPIMPAAEQPWNVIDRSTKALTRQRWLTDVAKYWFDFDSSDRLRIEATHHTTGTEIIELDSSRDVNIWLMHQPFLASLTRREMKEIQHMHVVGSALMPEPDLSKYPPTIKLSSGFLHPDDQSCPPVQVMF